MSNATSVRIAPLAFSCLSYYDNMHLCINCFVCNTDTCRYDVHGNPIPKHIHGHPNILCSVHVLHLVYAWCCLLLISAAWACALYLVCEPASRRRLHNAQKRWKRLLCSIVKNTLCNLRIQWSAHAVDTFKWAAFFFYASTETKTRQQSKQTYIYSSCGCI